MAIATDMGQMFCIAQENGFKLPPLPLGLRAPSSLGAGDHQSILSLQQLVGAERRVWWGKPGPIDEVEQRSAVAQEEDGRSAEHHPALRTGVAQEQRGHHGDCNHKMLAMRHSISAASEDAWRRQAKERIESGANPQLLAEKDLDSVMPAVLLFLHRLLLPWLRAALLQRPGQTACRCQRTRRASVVGLG